MILQIWLSDTSEIFVCALVPLVIKNNFTSEHVNFVGLFYLLSTGLWKGNPAPALIKDKRKSGHVAENSWKEKKTGE